ncbi:TIGR01777 family oxidoreductase [Psychromicrobium sp. YIM B11713]|uniref:TIGR01777 family oxidoreductase n=1 Tax=Psychromicrobium sp. YIM B11713 TaxID=3145233 RepID=UPI00374FCC74
MTQRIVVLAGASGFIGRHLRRRFSEEGWEVRQIGRGTQPGWGDTTGLSELLEGSDLLVNLAGKSVSCRYNSENKALIRSSRTETTAELGKAIAGCATPPRDWFNASTGTIYRHAEDRPQSEDDGELGAGFSVEVAKAWEAELSAASTPHTRKIPLRMSIVMGPAGRGSARKGPGGAGVMRPFEILSRCGLGGSMGEGSQKYSWIHVEDVFRAVLFIHEHPELQGAINLAAPQVVENRELMRQVRAALRIPFGLPTPRWLLSFGAVVIRTETELVLKSRWVAPEKLRAAGFSWRYPELSSALGAIREAEHR